MYHSGYLVQPEMRRPAPLACQEPRLPNWQVETDTPHPGCNHAIKVLLQKLQADVAASTDEKFSNRAYLLQQPAISETLSSSPG